MTKSSLVLVLVLVPLSACGRSEDGAAQLPPATGAGAAPRPKLPDVAAATGARAPGGGASDRRATGTTHPRERAEVAPSLSAIISAIEVDEGDLVKKGDVLFRLRTTDLNLRVDQARAAEASAKVGLAAARVELDRMQRLLEKDAVEQAQFDRVKAQYDTAKSGADQARVAVSLARRGLADAVVRSPITGVVTDVPKNAGEMATMMPPTVVVVVEDQSQLELRFRVPESQLAGLTPGAALRVEFESIAQKVAATITRLSPSVDPRTRTVEVIALLDNKDGKLRSGMLATVQLGAGESPATPPAAEPPAAAKPTAKETAP